MYSNIDLNLGIAAIRQWLEEESKTPQDRIEFTNALLTLVMHCNVFQFEDTFFLPPPLQTLHSTVQTTVKTLTPKKLAEISLPRPQ
jgi:hypothetical protein